VSFQQPAYRRPVTVTRPLAGHRLTAGAERTKVGGRDAEVLEVEMGDVRTAAVMEALASVYDPCCQEKGLSVVDMGLVRRVDLDGDQARVELLLTTGWCPFAANLVGQISERVAALPGMAGSTVEIVWDEPWTTDRLSDKARRTLRFLPHPKEVGP
jgi:metal-sulfur cluster biosynthetic enzyme